ncbi:diphthine--ammonia ligase [Algoriphagus lutimaris]|uniref:Dph6-related ATP pyrophosphatase n=1 Tax=Algoriphagus lutimaris TaxID=613197 RepID=UPI00196A72B1|nr:diphthine--ammonia ligase [Algoriphagus lutimaris]MBN3520314.1 diphthine--ammonia ligase [Algoriphagus lutimaris]
MSLNKAIFNWSGGKDSALALYKILQNKEFEVLTLLTSISEKFQRISMHGVRKELLVQQANSTGLALTIMEVPEMPTMESYETAMRNTLEPLVDQGAEASIFGDIFLEDLRSYRENKLAEIGLKGIFPIWKQPTLDLIREFIDLGFKTVTTCVNEKYLDQSFAGRVIDENFLKELPKNVDPCGENGEFHTFVFDGPIFSNPISYSIGETVYRKYEAPKKDNSNDCFQDDHKKEDPYAYGFWFTDLIPI